MKPVFTFILLLSSLSLAAQDTVVIPKGVVYKKKSTEINDKARVLLLQELNEKTATYSVFDGVLFMGPLLWKRYKTYGAIGNIQQGNVQFRVPVTDPVTKKQSREILNGKLIQSKDDFKTLWKQVMTDAGKPGLLIRKPTAKELSYYWAVINFDIEEPVFVVETGSFNLLFQFIDSKMTLYWLEEMPRE